MAALWVAACLVVVIITWEQSMAEVRGLHEQRERECNARYSAPDARERCMLLMDLERFQARSVAMFNRWLLIAGPPLIGLGAVVYLHRRRRPPARGTRGRR